MDEATSTVDVGIRDLKNNLSRYLVAVQSGAEFLVTDRGKPVARLTQIDVSTDRLAELVASGLVRPPARLARQKARQRTQVSGFVSDMVDAQRR